MPETITKPSALTFATRTGQVAYHALRERVRPPRTADQGAEVPVDKRDVTRAWLDDVLCAHVPGASVASFEPHDVSSGTSERWALRVQYNQAGTDAGLPTALFAKTTRSVRQRLFLGLSGFLECEPGFFNEFRPRLDIRAPEGYFAAVDQASWRSMVLLEDIDATRGAGFSTPRTPIDRSQMQDLLANMAVLHGTFWADHALEQRPWLRTPRQWFDTMRLIGMEKRARVGVERARSVIPARVADRQPDLYRALERSLTIASSGPLTLLHGDPHVGNTFADRDGRMGFVDWQVIQRGSWAYDVAYLLSAGLEVGDRREWERDLLGFYLEALQRAGGEAPAFETAWRAYREQLVYPYFAWLYTIGRSALQPKFQPDDVSLALLGRMSAAIADLGTAELLQV